MAKWPRLTCCSFRNTAFKSETAADVRSRSTRRFFGADSLRLSVGRASEFTQRLRSPNAIACRAASSHLWSSRTLDLCLGENTEGLQERSTPIPSVVGCGWCLVNHRLCCVHLPVLHDETFPVSSTLEGPRDIGSRTAVSVGTYWSRLDSDRSSTWSLQMGSRSTCGGFAGLDPRGAS